MRQENQNKLLEFLKSALAVSDFNYYQNLARIQQLALLIERYSCSQDRILNLGSGAFLLECILEENGYENLTAVDKDVRLIGLHKQLVNAGFLQHTKFEMQAITQHRSQEPYDFITIYDCAYYPANNIVKMLPQLAELANEGGHMFFDVYDRSVYWRIKPFYDLFRKKYRNRTMYNLMELEKGLSANGFRIVEKKPELGSKSKLSRTLLEAVYSLTGKALVVNYLVIKNPST